MSKDIKASGASGSGDDGGDVKTKSWLGEFDWI